jgi:hypothetical protein
MFGETEELKRAAQLLIRPMLNHFLNNSSKGVKIKNIHGIVGTMAKK